MSSTSVESAVKGNEVKESAPSAGLKLGEVNEFPPPAEPKPAPAGPTFPDGGLTAWLQVLAGFLIYFNTFGMTNSYGVFQTYYETRFPDQTPSNISWTGTIQSFIMFSGMLVTGPLFDQGYSKYLLISGTFFAAFGLFMTSIVTAYWQVPLAQGICVGIGFALLFNPCVNIPPQYFLKKRATALGLCAMGSSLGGIIYPIVFQKLLPQVGFGWAVRTMAFMELAMLVIATAVSKSRLPPKEGRALIDMRGVRSKPFMAFVAALFFGYIAVYIPFFYSQLYALGRAGFTGGPDGLAFYSLTLLNAGSVFGRVLPGIIADKIGADLTITILTAPCIILAFAWIAVRDVAGLFVWDVLYGFMSGAFVGLQTVVCVIILHLPGNPGMPFLGTWSGMGLFVAGIGVLIGNPIAGAIYKNYDSWVGLQAFCGAGLTVTVAFLAWMWLLIRREKQKAAPK